MIRNTASLSNTAEPRGARLRVSVTKLWLQDRRPDLDTSLLAAQRVSLWSAAVVPVVIALIALVLFTGGVAAFWFYIVCIGSARGVPAGVIGTTLSFTALSRILTAAAVAWWAAAAKALPSS